MLQTESHGNDEGKQVIFYVYNAEHGKHYSVPQFPVTIILKLGNVITLFMFL